MIYNELFESIIRTSGENTDDFDERDNFWAPIPENLLFERVLREASINSTGCYGIFHKNVSLIVKATYTIQSKVFTDLIDIFREFLKEEKYRDYVVLICHENGQLSTFNPIDLTQNAAELALKATEKLVEIGTEYQPRLQTYLSLLAREGVLDVRKFSNFKIDGKISRNEPVDMSNELNKFLPQKPSIWKNPD